MAPRQHKTSRSKTALPPPLAAVNLHAAGIAMGAASHFVAVPPRDDPQPVRGCGACPADLAALADGLATCGMTPLALASPGVSGSPLGALLETRGVDVLVGDPPQGPQLKGRPTSDRHDCPWRQRLHPCGRLAAALRPADQVGGGRRSLRQRARLCTAAAPPLQPRPKALTQMHVTLQPVVSALPGGTGLALLRALRAGARAPAPRAPLRDARGQPAEAPIARAMPGHGRAEPHFAVAQALDFSECSPRKIRACADNISPHWQTCAERSAGPPFPPSPRPRQPGRNPPACAARAPLHRLTGGDLPPREGLDETTALLVLSAIGFARSRWAPPQPSPRQRTTSPGSSTACARPARRLACGAWTNTPSSPGNGQ